VKGDVSRAHERAVCVAQRRAKRRGGQGCEVDSGPASPGHSEARRQDPWPMLVRVQLLSRLDDNQSAATNRATRSHPMHRVSFWGLPAPPCPFNATHRPCSSATKCDAPCAPARPRIERRSTPEICEVDQTRWTLRTFAARWTVDAQAMARWTATQRAKREAQTKCAKSFRVAHAPCASLFNY